jgi:RNA polymerase sigma-70 factor (ECF subfamily)
METDTALVQAARAGSKPAFAELVARHRPLLVRLCGRMLADPALAEDAAQEATLHAYLDLARLRRPERFGPWLAGIGLNVCRHWLRDRWHDHLSLDGLDGGRFHPEADVPDPAGAAELAFVRDAVLAAVAALPQSQRAAVVLAYLAGLTQAEIAAELGIEPNAVKARLHKARAALRRTLEYLMEEEGMEPPRDEWVEMEIEGIYRRPPNEENVAARGMVLLRPIGNPQGRALAIWIGPVEAWGIAAIHEKFETARPLTPLLMFNVIQAAGLRVREVRITKLAEQTFVGDLVLAGRRSDKVIDARPSDLLPLALLQGAPIKVHAEVLAAVAEQHPNPPAPNWRDRFEDFKDIVAEYKANQPLTGFRLQPIRWPDGVIDANRLHEALGFASAEGLSSEEASRLERLRSAVQEAEAGGRLKPCFAVAEGRPIGRAFQRADLDALLAQLG